MKFWDDVGDTLYSQSRLSMSCFAQKIFAIKSRSRRKTEKPKFFGPKFFGRNDPQILTAVCWRDLLSTVWQSLVEFRLLTSVCEAW